MPLEGKTRTVKAGDRVFRVRSAEAAFEDDAREPRVPLVGTATLHIGEPLRMEFHPAAIVDLRDAGFATTNPVGGDLGRPSSTATDPHCEKPLDAALRRSLSLDA